MRRDRIIYWITTGIVCAVMVFSIIIFTFFDTYFYPEGAFNHLGLPLYFKIELTLAKALGVLALMLPKVPLKLKDFAYFGFVITLLSGSIAHLSSGDGIVDVIKPLAFLGILLVSYRYFNKLHRHKSKSHRLAEK